MNPQDRSMQAVLSYTEDLARLSYGPGETLTAADLIDAIVEGAVAQPDVLTAALKTLFKKSGCKCRRIVTSISGHAVIVKKVTFNQMDENELRELIRAAIRGMLISLDPHSDYLDPKDYADIRQWFGELVGEQVAGQTVFIRAYICSKPLKLEIEGIFREL